MSQENKENKKYLPPLVMKNIMEYKYGVKGSCEIITGQGKRCKNATKYRFGDEIKDCGSYCSKHCSIWIEDLLKGLFYGDVIIDGEKVKINSFTITGLLEYPNPELIIRPGISIEYDYFNVKWRKLKLMKDDSKVDEWIKNISKEMCSWKRMTINFIFSTFNRKTKISSLDVAGIRGWKIKHFEYYIEISKEYNIDFN